MKRKVSSFTLFGLSEKLCRLRVRRGPYGCPETFPVFGLSFFGTGVFEAMLIFFPGSKSAADVTLLLVDIQHFAHFTCQFRIDLHQAVYHIFVYGGFADSEFFCSLSDGCFGLNHITGNLYGPFFYIIFQGNPRNTYFYNVCG